VAAWKDTHGTVGPLAKLEAYRLREASISETATAVITPESESSPAHTYLLFQYRSPQEKQMATYRKFAGNKTLDVIRAQCKAQGVQFIDSQYKRGSDFVTLRSPDAWVMFSVFNGRFFGRTPDGVEFMSDDKRDGTPWFDALLDFFYVRKPA
jgi:hypothetical protein